jgi:hypothetical protein
MFTELNISRVKRAGSNRAIAGEKPTFGCLSDLGECLGDHELTEIRRFQIAEKQPSTNNSTPFTKLESSEARNSATVAISSERPIFPRGGQTYVICCGSGWKSMNGDSA